jgi:thioredoxin reductase (NADPH)
MRRPQIADVEIAVVGAGPAGLSAALYSARYCRATLVLHDDASRASRIPITRNVPGLADGIAGKHLLARMSHQVERCGAVIESARVTNALFEHDRFLLTSLDGKQWSARALILATGVELNQIPLDDKTHEAAIRMGVLRYCSICDGYEHRGQRIAVVGFDASGAAEALFLRRYSTDMTFLPAAMSNSRQRSARISNVQV